MGCRINGVEQVNAKRSQSKINDVDHAKEQSNYVKDQITQETQSAMRSHSQVAAQQVLSLLK